MQTRQLQTNIRGNMRIIIHKLDWIRGSKGLVPVCMSNACKLVTCVSQDWNIVTCKNCLKEEQE